MMKFLCPKPPSVNRIYGLTTRGGFARSYIVKDGIEWFETAAKILGKTFKRKTISDPVEVWVELYHTRKQDIDNIGKPILDLLSKRCVKCQSKVVRGKGCACGKNWTVLLDDDQVYLINLEKFPIKKGEDEHVTIEIMGYS